MPYQTEDRLKNYLDTNQLKRERMCRAILMLDRRFTNVKPRHPRGGPDGGRDIEAMFLNETTAFGAAGFANGACETEILKREIHSKFKHDIESSLKSEKKAHMFVFFY